MEVTPHTWHARVRTYECDVRRHVNNACYVAYLQQATAEAWEELGLCFWDLRRLAIEYLAPAVSGDELEVMAWPEGAQGELVHCGYEVRRAGRPAALARASAAWAMLDPQTREACAPVAWPVETPAGHVLPRPLRLPEVSLDARCYRWQHRVRNYELDASERVSPVQILHWIEEAKVEACREVGWPLHRLAEEDCIIVQVRHDTEFLAGLEFGEAVEIVSRVCDLGRVRGTWRHEVRRDGELAVVDYSSGAFLNRSGRPSPPPQAMLEALIAKA